MARLIMRVVNSILPGRRAARGVPLAELCSVLLLAETDERKAIRAHPGTGANPEFNAEEPGHLTANQSSENAYQKGVVRLDRAVSKLPQSPIVRRCLAAAVVAAASVSVLGVLALRPTAEILSAAGAVPNSAGPGSTGASVPSPDPSTAAGPITAGAVATDQHYMPKSPGEPQNLKRSLDPEPTVPLTLPPSSSAEATDLTAASPSAAERSPEIASARATPVLAARPPAAAPAAPDDRAAPKAGCTAGCCQAGDAQERVPERIGLARRAAASNASDRSRTNRRNTAIRAPRGDSRDGGAIGPG
jgi:hypothetical protein